MRRSLQLCAGVCLIKLRSLVAVVVRSDSCAAGYAAYAIGLTSSMFPAWNQQRTASRTSKGQTADEVETCLRVFRVALVFGMRVFFDTQIVRRGCARGYWEAEEVRALCELDRFGWKALSDGNVNQPWIIQETSHFVSSWTSGAQLENITRNLILCQQKSANYTIIHGWIKGYTHTHTPNITFFLPKKDQIRKKSRPNLRDKGYTLED